jgi:hypothetical protein
MASLRRLGLLLRGAGSATDDVVDMTGPVRVPVVGESFHQQALSGIAGPKQPGGVEVPVRAKLVAEPDNPYDANAVAVHVSGTGMVGHLGREDAVKYQPVVRDRAAQHRSVVCDAIVFGGDSARDTYFCVWLHLCAPATEGLDGRS